MLESLTTFSHFAMSLRMLTPNSSGVSIRSDMAKWEKVARDSNIARIN